MKLYIFTKKDFLYLCIVALLSVTIIFSLVPCGKYILTEATEKKLPIYAVNTDKPEIALTFDCAWENSDTDILIDLLDEYGVKATFFTTGDWCERYPDDVKKLFAKGHAIENHSYNHPHVASIEREKLIEDTKKCDEIIESLTGVKPTLYRAPYGEYSNRMLSVFENDLKHFVIQWDCDSVDWKGREADEMAASIIKRAKNGSILLFHNDTPNTPDALKIIIPELSRQGYKFVLVNELIYRDNFALDHEGRQTKLS